MANNDSYFEPIIGSFCKKDCFFCCEGGYGKRDFISFSNFKKAIKKNNFKKVILSGGEPLSNKNILEYIKYCKERKIYVGLVTAWDKDYDNKILKKLEEYGLNEIMFSILGPEKIHDLLVKQTGAYAAIIEALYFIGKNNLNLKVSIATNINKINYLIIASFVSKILKLFNFIFSYRIQFLRLEGSCIKNFDMIFDSYSKLITPFLQKINSINSIEKVTLVEAPYCIIPRENRKLLGSNLDIYRDFSIETDFCFSDRNSIFKINKSSKIEKRTLSSGKYFSKICSKCIYYNKCPGFMKNYIDKFGEREIKPISL